MDSTHEILHNDHQQPSPPDHTTTIKNLHKKIIFFLALAGSMIFSSTCKNKREPEPFNSYPSGPSRYYCYLTTYPELCHDIMSIINITVLESKPGPIFSASFQLAIYELNNTTISITKALSSSSTTNKFLLRSRLSKCRKLVRDSLSRLNESLCLLGVDSDVESLTDREIDNMMASTFAASTNAVRCLFDLEEGDRMAGKEKIGVEEVKLQVEKSRKYMVNSILLLHRKELILKFYNKVR